MQSSNLLMYTTEGCIIRKRTLSLVEYETMNMEKIDLTELKPVIYAPYNYFSIGEKLGEMGDWVKYGGNIK